MSYDDLYEIARLYWGRALSEQARRFGTWQPDDAQDDGTPHADPARWWYLQGKAVAYAAIMRAIEESR